MSNNGLNLPDIDIDLRGVESFGGGGGGPKLPVGAYTMDISNIEQTTSKKGNSQLKITFKVADEGEFFGVEVFNWYSLKAEPSEPGKKAAIGRLAHLMMAAGCDLDKIRTSQLMGARVIVDIIHEAGEGKLDAQGNMQPGGMFTKVVNEKAIQVEADEPPPPPPPAARKPVAAAAAPAKNGSTPVARRA